MRTALFLRAFIFCLLFSLPAQAQMPGLFPAKPAAAPDAPAAQTDPTRALVDILRDEKAREALIQKLLATAEAPTAKPAAEVPPQPSLARQIAENTRDTAESAMSFIFSIGHSLRDVADVLTGARPVNWLEFQNAALALVLVMLVTIGLFLILRTVGHRIYHAMSRRTERGSWFFSVLRIVASSLIDGFIIVLAWAGGYAFALAIGESGSMDFRQSLFLNAFLIVELGKVVLRAIFAPRFHKLRFAPMSDETAAYWYFWSSRLVGLLGYGVLFVVPIVNEVVSFALGRSLTTLIVVTALLMAILIVLQNRAPIRAALRARHEHDPEDMIGRAEAAVAGIWHWLAIAYLIALFLVWSIRAGDALQFMLVATLNSVVAVVVGMVAMMIVTRLVAGGMRLPEDVRRTLPLLEVRLNAFVPTLLKVIRALIFAAVVVVIAQTWQVLDFIGFLATEAGRELSSRALSLMLIAILAFAAWLTMSSFIEYRLNPGVGKVPTARERTLLALFRSAFMIVLAVMTTMLVLSEVGVNIGPLLAGAGVLGLAIGVGSQKLVQDVINGAFIQLENAMNEGDVVTAGGTTGVVERMTIRSVGLRDLSGTYHLIPFSAVDQVSNFMKGFAFHVAEVSVAYRENVAEVKELMLKAFDIIKGGELGEHILEPLEVHGVSAMGDSAVVVRARIKTKPGMQWSVGRAYNEIVKSVLDEAGVEIPFPHLTVYMGQGKDGSAPPLNLRRIDEPSPEKPKKLDAPANASPPGDHPAGDGPSDDRPDDGSPADGRSDEGKPS